MNDDKKLQFFDELTALLKGKVMPKSLETLNGERYCDCLKHDITQLYEQTHRLGLFSDKFFDQFGSFSYFISQHVDFPLERLKEQMEKTWLRDKLTIGFMGHFSTGKTTALNLLFDESFQVNRHENTAIATYLAYGQKQNVVTIVDRGGLSQELTFDQCSVLDYSVGVKDFPFARIFNYMVKENRANLLKDLTIIDTPGLFSTQTGHSAPTMNVVSSCDVIFWFINITSSVTDKDIKVMKDSLQGKPVFIVFTFVDALGTTPAGVDSSIKSIVAKLEKEIIDYRGYLTLGKKENAQIKFKNDTLKLLKNMLQEYEVYLPEVHISDVIKFLVDFLVHCQSQLTKQIEVLDKETDDLINTYKASSRTFATECDNSTNRFNNMINTFNNRCNGATFCGGAASALCNNINSISSSLNSMVRAYNNLDVQKLIEFGEGTAQMSLCQDKLDKIAGILDSVKKIKAEYKI